MDGHPCILWMLKKILKQQGNKRSYKTIRVLSVEKFKHYKPKINIMDYAYNAVRLAEIHFQMSLCLFLKMSLCLFLKSV